MADKPVFCCPICSTPLAYQDRVPQHLRNEHGDKQVGYTQLELAAVNTIVVTNQGEALQKFNNVENCWLITTTTGPANMSTWQLVRVGTPVYRVVGESNG